MKRVIPMAIIILALLALIFSFGAFMYCSSAIQSAPYPIVNQIQAIWQVVMILITLAIIQIIIGLIALLVKNGKS